MIQFTEAENRGAVYNLKHASYLFDLNQDLCIDGYRLGNKTKFLNHSGDPDAINIVPVAVFVNGEHRMKFSASKPVPVGQELVFDYGERFARVQGLITRGKDKAKNTEASKTSIVDQTASRVTEALLDEVHVCKTATKPITESLKEIQAAVIPRMVEILPPAQAQLMDAEASEEDDFVFDDEMTILQQQDDDSEDPDFEPSHLKHNADEVWSSPVKGRRRRKINRTRAQM